MIQDISELFFRSDEASFIVDICLSFSSRFLPLAFAGFCAGRLRSIVYELSDVLVGKLPASRGLPSLGFRCFCFEAHFTACEQRLRRARARRTWIPRAELSTRPEDFMLRSAQARGTLIPLGPLSKMRHERKRGRGEVTRESYFSDARKLSLRCGQRMRPGIHFFVPFAFFVSPPSRGSIASPSSSRQPAV